MAILFYMSQNFIHYKLGVAVARHNFERVKIILFSALRVNIISNLSNIGEETVQAESQIMLSKPLSD